MAKEPRKGTWGGAGRGQGRKPRDPEAGKLVKTAITLAPKHIDQLDAAVEAGKGVSRSELIGRALDAYLPGLVGAGSA